MAYTKLQQAACMGSLTFSECTQKIKLSHGTLRIKISTNWVSLKTIVVCLQVLTVNFASGDCTVVRHLLLQRAAIHERGCAGLTAGI